MKSLFSTMESVFTSSIQFILVVGLLLINVSCDKNPVTIEIIPDDPITDIDGNVYQTVKIGNQVWTVENLRTTKYNDGSPIRFVTETGKWDKLDSAGYCWYNNDTTNKITYGALYNWHSVNTGILAPAGWHVPTDEDWTALGAYLGSDDVAGGKLKESGSVHWLSPNNSATNETGFSALPGGFRYSSGYFNLFRTYGFWWSSSEADASSAFDRHLCNSDGNLFRSSYSKRCGFSVRLVKDTE